MRSVRSRSSRTSTKPAMLDVPRRRRAGPDGRCMTLLARSRSQSPPPRRRTPAQAETRPAGAAQRRPPPAPLRAARPSRPWRGLAVGGEIDRDAEAERDRQPRQQPPGPTSAATHARTRRDGAQICETVGHASTGRRQPRPMATSRHASARPRALSLLDHRAAPMPRYSIATGAARTAHPLGPCMHSRQLERA